MHTVNKNVCDTTIGNIGMITHFLLSLVAHGGKHYIIC